MALFGLAKTRDSLFGKLSRAVAGRSRIDDDVLDSIEEALIASDVGVDTAIELIEAIEARVAEKQYLGAKELQTLIREALLIQLEAWGSVKAPVEAVKGVRPHVTLLVGVNGVGKTTTIGKLATFYKQQGQSVLLGAADTFRAAAVDQLRIWAERSGASFVEKGMHTDPAAVAFAAVESGKIVAVANKEPLVMAGELFLQTAEKTGAKLLPTDSEHNAIFQALHDEPPVGIERLT